MRIVEGENELTLQNRFFSIKRRGRLFQSRPRRPVPGVHSRDLGVYSGPGVYLLNVFFIHPFLIISTGGLLNWEPNVKQCHQLCLISENLVCHLSKKHHRPERWLNFLTFYFSVKDGGSVSATVPQQTYCASNSEQGGGEPEVPAPSVTHLLF